MRRVDIRLVELVSTRRQIRRSPSALRWLESPLLSGVSVWVESSAPLALIDPLPVWARAGPANRTAQQATTNAFIFKPSATQLKLDEAPR
jgi:hypothetical protein